MIIEETINELLFQEQRTYRIYKSEEDKLNGKFALATSDERTFLDNKQLAKQKEQDNSENQFIINI